MTSRAGNQSYRRKAVPLSERRYGFTNPMRASKHKTLFSMNPIQKKRIWKAVRLGLKEMILVGCEFDVVRDKDPTGTHIFWVEHRSKALCVEMRWDAREERAVLLGKNVRRYLNASVTAKSVELEFKDYDDVPEIIRDWLDNPHF